MRLAGHFLHYLERDGEVPEGAEVYARFIAAPMVVFILGIEIMSTDFKSWAIYPSTFAWIFVGIVTTLAVVILICDLIDDDYSPLSYCQYNNCCEAGILVWKRLEE